MVLGMLGGVGLTVLLICGTCASFVISEERTRLHAYEVVVEVDARLHREIETLGRCPSDPYELVPPEDANHMFVSCDDQGHHVSFGWGFDNGVAIEHE